MEVGKTKCSPEQIRTAVSRFLFSFVRDPEPEIPSPTSLPWRLATRFGTLFFSQAKEYDSTGLRRCMHVCMYTRLVQPSVRSFFRSVKDDTFIHTRYVHHARATIQSHKRLLFDVTVSCLFLSSQDHIPNEPSFSYKE
jgi:hypothetical protein